MALDECDNLADLFLACMLALVCDLLPDACRVGIACVPGFCSRYEIEMKLKALCRACGWTTRGFRFGELDSTSVRNCKHFLERFIQAQYKLRIGAKIRGELDGMERKGFLFTEFKSSFFHAVKQLGLGVAEEINGLHGIADHEDGCGQSDRPRP